MPALRLGGSDATTALTIDGRTWSYREFATLVEAHITLARTTAPGPLIATGLPVAAALASVFAAASAGVPVVVGNPNAPEPTHAAAFAGPPPGTLLIAVTSGTSGHPRPVLRTAASWTTSFAPLAELAGIGPDDRVLLTGPLHATMHLFAAVHTLAIGAELTDQPSAATAVHAVPAVLADLLAALSDDAPLRTAVLAGTSLPADLAARATGRGIAVTEYYGAAELSFVAAARYPQALRPFPGTEVQIRAGELWVRSPYLAIGYPTGVSGPLQWDDLGFASVGDLAAPTADGGLVIRGRGDAAITTGGATVVAEDIEDALIRLPGVAAAAVVGVPHVRLGQVVTAVIEPVSGADLSGLRSDARAALRAESLPRRWFVTDRLPRTPSGKVARAQVAGAAGRWVADAEPVVTGSSEPPPAETVRLRPLP